MAIDTAEKRRSISFIPNLVPGVTPNASPDAEWRREAGYGYALAADTPPAFAIDTIDAAVKMDDLGLYVDTAFVGWNISSENVQMNVKKGGA